MLCELITKTLQEGDAAISVLWLRRLSHREVTALPGRRPARWMVALALTAWPPWRRGDDRLPEAGLRHWMWERRRRSHPCAVVIRVVLEISGQ